jgi:plasmid stabilization system protein ParE
MKRYRLDPDAAIDIKSIYKYNAADNTAAANRLMS